MSDRIEANTPYNFYSSRITVATNTLRQRLSVAVRDRVVWAFAALIGAAALHDLDAVPPLLAATGTSLAETGPFIAGSILFAALVKATGSDRLIAAALAGRTHVAVMTAAVFGALSPFCSCGVVPLIAAMLAAGVPLAPVMAFWLASPVIDPEMMILSWGILGAEMTLAKMLSAILLGLLGGTVVALVRKAGGFAAPLKPGVGGNAGGCGPSACGDGAPSEAIDPTARPVWRFWRERARRRLFVGEIGNAGWFLGKWLTVAFLLEAIMLRWVPMETVAAGLSSLGAWSIPAAAAVGVPSYLNGYAAIPLVRGLMDAGLPPGAALSFMVAGGVTCIPAAVAVQALVRAPITLAYLTVAAVGSVSVGFLYSAWILIFAG